MQNPLLGNRMDDPTWMDGMDGWMDGWMDGRTDGRMDGWIMASVFRGFVAFDTLLMLHGSWHPHQTGQLAQPTPHRRMQRPVMQGPPNLLRHKMLEA